MRVVSYHLLHREGDNPPPRLARHTRGLPARETGRHISARTVPALSYSVNALIGLASAVTENVKGMKCRREDGVGSEEGGGGGGGDAVEYLTLKCFEAMHGRGQILIGCLSKF